MYSSSCIKLLDVIVYIVYILQLTPRKQVFLPLQSNSVFKLYYNHTSNKLHL
jgi:hypothetical protein